MNNINITAGSPKPQRCDPPTFFYILDRIELTTLEEAVAGPGRRGPKLKELRPTVRLHQWYRYCHAVDTDNPPDLKGLRRELEDPGSDLFELCGFDEGKKLPHWKTIAGHFLRIEQHPELVNDVVSEIKQYAPYASCDAGSPKPTKEPTKAEKVEKSERAEKEPHREEESDPSKRNKENVDYRRRRRNEAVGKRELDSIVASEDTAYDFMSSAIHGRRRSCNKCKEKKARGWECTKDHVHGVIVEVQTKQGQHRQWKCHCCESRLSVTSGTIFHGTNFSCREILIALYEIVKSRSGVSSLDVAGALNMNGRNVSEGAARMLMHRFRECMREDKPGGFGGETEVDEMLLRLDNGRLVSILTLYNRPTGCVRFGIVERKGEKNPRQTGVRCCSSSVRIPYFGPQLCLTGMLPCRNFR